MDYLAPDPVLLHARLRPTGLACIDLSTNRRWTYAELNADVQRATTVLRGLGGVGNGVGDGGGGNGGGGGGSIQTGDRVATVSANSVHQIILHHALARLGAVHVPLNWRLARPELAKLLLDCTPVLLLSDLLEPDPPGLLPLGCRHVGLSSFAAAVDAAEPGPRLDARPSTETRVVLYTSGTSGAPKGVRLTARSMLATTCNFGVLAEVDAGSVFLCDGPMFHLMGLIAQTGPAVMHGGTCIVSPRFNPEITNARLGDAGLRVTHYFCVPHMAEALARAPNFDPSEWAALKALFTGGAPNPPARVRWWLGRGVRMVDGYGSTEIGTASGMPLSRDLIGAKAGSVGLPGPLTAVRVVDGRDRDVPVGAPGEILVSGPSVTPGYWNRRDEDVAGFTGDGWFRTGDVGRVDEDGYIFLIDRRKNMFISGGENVYPAEVEAALAEHPGVVDVAVVGVPDQLWGEAGRAYVIAAPGSQLAHADLVGHCQALLARFKVPRETVFVGEFPRTGSGKVQKHLLAEDSVARL
ncbi:Long-chain-fatty-acid--CoA ligase FadD13 [Colletotrichum shisoi]|uniref:Long-chain-fatty-acid--CoA ligase FadD13 n=1 Tax=Colletotrichum shisoi TaxID=2078593 RepID=A0A5Q4BP31_9PEZI|nr:Long-chain-fatty-acid--CoA ligase FadD13 [Colletotrichum shisoi]